MPCAKCPTLPACTRHGPVNITCELCCFGCMLDKGASCRLCLEVLGQSSRFSTVHDRFLHTLWHFGHDNYNAPTECFPDNHIGSSAWWAHENQRSFQRPPNRPIRESSLFWQSCHSLSFRWIRWNAGFHYFDIILITQHFWSLTRPNRPAT